MKRMNLEDLSLCGPGDPPTMCAVLTGSRVYGTPREDSDVDLAVLVSLEDFDKLVALFPPGGEADSYKGCPAQPLRIGKLNLLLVTSEAHLAIWRAGTDILKANAPVTREQAMQLFAEMRGGQ